MVDAVCVCVCIVDANMLAAHTNLYKETNVCGEVHMHRQLPVNVPDSMLPRHGHADSLRIICAYFPLSPTYIHIQAEWNALADAHETWAKLYLNSGNDHITSVVGCQVNN